MTRHRNAMHSSGDDDGWADIEVYSLSNTDQVWKSGDYVYGITQYESTSYKNRQCINTWTKVRNIWKIHFHVYSSDEQNSADYEASDV